MNLDFSDDQKLLQSQAEKLLTDSESTVEARRVLDSHGEQPYSESLWKKVCELGFTACNIDEAYGGLGLGSLELCVLAESFGRHLAPIPFSSSIYLAAQGINLYGDEQQKQQWLPKLASGECIGTLAMAESKGAITPKNIQASVAKGKLSGTKIAVPDGGVADIALVVATEGNSINLYLASLAGDTVTRQIHNSVDPSRPVSEISFDNHPVEQLGTAGWDELQSLLDRAACLFAFEQVGAAEACLDLSKEYALERKAFGRQIASYQAIKHRMADMYIGNTLARSNAYYAAWALSTDAPELPVAAATARISATQALNYAAKECIQIHGGMGFTWEFDCHLYYRRARSQALMLGSEITWKHKLVNSLKRKNTQQAK